jgi:hypothetical protein
VRFLVTRRAKDRLIFLVSFMQVELIIVAGLHTLLEDCGGFGVWFL